MYIPNANQNTSTSQEFQNEYRLIKLQELKNELAKFETEKQEKLTDRQKYLTGEIGTPKYAQISKESRISGGSRAKTDTLKNIDRWIAAIDNEIAKTQAKIVKIEKEMTA